MSANRFIDGLCVNDSERSKDIRGVIKLIETTNRLKNNIKGLM